MTIPILECHGSPRQVGEQTGEALRDMIKHNLELAQIKPGTSWEKRKARKIKVLKESLPDIYDEICGIATGANLPEDDLLCMNFTSLFSNELDEGCTNIVFSGGNDGPVWGKNNDGVFPAKDRKIAVRKIKYDKGLPIISFEACGRIGSNDGMNEAGVTIGHSSVGSVFQQSDDYVPVRPWGYQALRFSRNSREFVGKLSSRLHSGKGFSMLIVDAEGVALSAELACPLTQIRKPAQKHGICCVNCYQLPQLANADRRSAAAKENALQRAAFLNNELDKNGDFDINHMKALLQHHGNPDICCHGTEKGDHVSLYSMIGLPAKGKALFTAGNPCENEFNVVGF